MRVNAKDRDGQERTSESDTSRWMIGPTVRDRGSVHSDVWSGSASDLVDKEFIAIVPVKGWWSEVAALRAREVRYSLVVTIETTEIDSKVDFYTEVATELEAEIENPLEAF